MVRRRASRSVAELDAQLAEIEDDPSTSILTLAQQSAIRMHEQQGGTFQAISARFTGKLAGTHEIGVRESTQVLGELQEVLAEVGAVVSGKVPRRGPLPADIVAATELRFSPEVLPGSVIFTLHPAHDESMFAVGDSLLRQAIGKLFELFDSVEKPVTSDATEPDAVAQVLHAFGPRTAKHLVDFASALGNNDLNVDIGFMATGRQTRASRISSAGARFLGGVAKKATKRTEEVDLIAQVHRLGIDNKHVVVDEERGKITIASNDEVTSVLHAAFSGSKVRIRASETLKVSTATGATTATYEALRAEPFPEGHAARILRAEDIS